MSQERRRAIRQRLVSAVRARRRIHLVIAMLFFAIALSAFHTIQLDGRTTAVAVELAEARTLLRVLHDASGDPEVEARLGATERVQALEAACAQAQERCVSFSRTVGLPAAWLGVRCTAVCR
ncbi:MAG: hypothetical protein EA398_02980 [Deltaproteobacteria bacterium]|nr:MAG: hypothetical protein EA398_02980 [Deltaproteobacteria bacterium]